MSFFAVYIITKNLTSIPTGKPVFLLLLISFATIGPTLSYLWHRYHTGKEYGYHHILEFYRFPDLKHARNIASTQMTMFEDMNTIELMTDTEETILHFAPVYIALLANRHSQSISFSYSDEDLYKVNNISDAEYVYISRIHPRKTRKNINGLDLQVYFNGTTEPLWTHHSEENGEPVSVFLKTIK